MKKSNRNKKSAGRTVRYQYLTTTKTNANYSGERSPYWDWMAGSRDTSLTELGENLRANPDAVPDEGDDYDETRRELGAILDAALSRLTRRQTQVLRLMQHGKTQEKIAEMLHISQPMVNKHITAIQNKLIKHGYKNDANA